MWADISEVPTAATRVALRTYVGGQLEKYADLPLDAFGGPNPTNEEEKRKLAYLRWLHDLQKIDQEKALV
jgi:hypothetical protein